MRRHAEICGDMRRYVETYKDMRTCGDIQRHADIHRHAKTCGDIQRHAETYKDMRRDKYIDRHTINSLYYSIHTINYKITLFCNLFNIKIEIFFIILMLISY